MPIDETWLKRKAAKLAPPAPAVAEIVQDERCVQCGYDLSGLEAGGVCPECGTLIAVSTGDAEEAEVSTSELRRVMLASKLLTLGVATFAIAPAAIAAVVPASGASTLTPGFVAERGVALLGAILCFVGIVALAIDTRRPTSGAPRRQALIWGWRGFLTGETWRLLTILGALFWPLWVSTRAVMALTQGQSGPLFDAIAVATGLCLLVASLALIPAAAALQRFCMRISAEAPAFAMQVTQFGLATAGAFIGFYHVLHALLPRVAASFSGFFAIAWYGLLPLSILSLVGFAMLWHACRAELRHRQNPLGKT